MSNPLPLQGSRNDLSPDLSADEDARPIDSQEQDEGKRFSLGVLLVHGIGTQQIGDTLVSWGDRVLKVIAECTNNQVTATVEWAQLGEPSNDRPAQAHVRITSEHTDEEWLFVEGWWAEAFRAPSYRDLMRWSIRALPWALSLHVAQRYWLTSSQLTKKTKTIALTRAVVTLLLALAFSPIFIVLLGLTLVLGLIPISRLRTFILTAQSTLTSTLGDSLAFVESPLRAALIRTRILQGLATLKKQCNHTVILAHSQGAAATLDALGGIGPGTAGQQLASGVTQTPSTLMPDALVTFGAGINQLASLRVLARGLPNKIGLNPTYLGVGGLLVAGAVIGWLYAQIKAHRIGLENLGIAALVWLAAIAFATLGVFAADRLVKFLSARSPEVKNRAANIFVWLSAAVMLGVVTGSMLYFEHRGLPIAPVNYLFLTFFFVAGSTKIILSRDLATVVTEGVRQPLALSRWVDIYASADPVPNGKTRIASSQSGAMESVPVWNRGSLLTDHTTYWENTDGFVLRVARILAQEAHSGWEGQVPHVTSDVDRRAEWRVKWLRTARVSTFVTMAVLFWVIWYRHQAGIPIPIAFPAWVPAFVIVSARFTVLAIAILVAEWLVCACLFGVWNQWTQAEQKLSLANKTSEGMAWDVLTVMGMIVWALILLVLLIVSPNPGSPSQVISAVASTWSDWLPELLGFGFGSVALTRVFLRPPRKIDVVDTQAKT